MVLKLQPRLVHGNNGLAYTAFGDYTFSRPKKVYSAYRRGFRILTEVANSHWLSIRVY